MNEVAGADADKVERAQGRLYGVWVIEHNICNAIEHYPSLKRGMAVRDLTRFDGSAVTGSRGSCMGVHC